MRHTLAHTLTHIRTHSRPLAVGTCTTCCVLSSLCVCSSWSSLTALSLCALTQFVLTFAQLTHPLEWRQAAAAALAAAAAALSAWLILTTRMATLSSAYDAYAAWLAAKCSAQLFNNLANSHHSHRPPSPSPTPSAVPFGRQDTTEKFSNRCARRSKFPLAISSSSALSLTAGRTFFSKSLQINKFHCSSCVCHYPHPSADSSRRP